MSFLSSIMMLWNKEYQEYDLVVSSVTTKLKGVAKITIPDIGEVVWDVVDYSGPYQVNSTPFVIIIIHATKKLVISKSNGFMLIPVTHKNEVAY